ncbi:MAG: RloB domain-containing protein [Spirochaetales bacterium]|nr:RloB domain-containing protein [Spirochaetales bacterium]
MGLTSRQKRPLNHEIRHLRDTRIIVIAGVQLLADVCSKAINRRRQKISLAISNPSFEFWLYLHLCEWTDSRVTSGDIEQALREQLGSYNKANLDIDLFEHGVDIAVIRAKHLNIGSDSRWPPNPGTHVYRVVEAIRELQ